MGQRSGAGQYGKARGQADFDQARVPLIQTIAAADRIKKAAGAADSLVPSAGKFGYAGTRQLIRNGVI
jgi:hypothetical protein